MKANYLQEVGPFHCLRCHATTENTKPRHECDKDKDQISECTKECPEWAQSFNPISKGKYLAEKKADEFVRICKKIKDHLVAEGVELSDYEIGHLAILWQEEIETWKK